MNGNLKQNAAILTKQIKILNIFLLLEFHFLSESKIPHPIPSHWPDSTDIEMPPAIDAGSREQANVSNSLLNEIKIANWPDFSEHNCAAFN